MSSQECIAQRKLHNLEKNLINYYKKNGHPVFFGGSISSRDVINMSGTRYREKPVGFYLYTIGKRAKETHGIIIEKRKGPHGINRFLLFDPNGKTWANKLRKGIPCNQRGGTNEYGICIKDGDDLYDLDKVNTPDKAWNVSGQCSLWTLVMLVVFINMPGRVSEVLRELSYLYPRDEYNYYNGLEIYTKGDVFMIQFVKDFYSRKYDFISEKEILEFINLVERSINIFLRSPYELDHADIKRTVYTEDALKQLTKDELVIICKVRMYKYCNTLNPFSLIYNILSKQKEKGLV